MIWGSGIFKVLIDGKVFEYDHWDKIPESYDNLIKFYANIPSGPHTESQHDDINTLPIIFKSFLKREKNAGRN